MATAKHPPIGPRLRALRLQLRWSQNHLSDLSGLRRIEISAIESGRNLGTSWRVRTLLAKGFGVKKSELDAYLEGAGSPNEIAAAVRPRGAEKASPVRLTPAGPAPAGFFSKFPNLRDAVRIVTKDSGAEEDFVKEAAYRVAMEVATDKKILEWATLLTEELDRISGTRINPLKIPNLAAAIRLLALENPLAEPRMKEIAALLVAKHSDALTPPTIEWVRALDRALGTETVAETAKPKRTGTRKTAKR